MPLIFGRLGGGGFSYCWRGTVVLVMSDDSKSSMCLRMFRVLLSFLVLETDETDCERRKAMMRRALIMIYL
jgi:hypothetical protein